jgi:hypothetical protein
VVRFGYAQARLQARLGQRALPEVQHAARAARDLPGYLQQVRSTALARHVGRIAPGMDAHEVERRLRHEWATTVAEVARWLPQPWREATVWLQWLPYLPALQKLARGGRANHWMRDEPMLARIIAVEPGARAGGLRGTSLEPLQEAIARHGDVTQAWLEHWRRCWPADVPARLGLERLLRQVREVTQGLRDLSASASSDELLQRLGARLLRQLRRHPLSPLAAYAYLGLEALDLLELRGAIVRRIALTVAA